MRAMSVVLALILLVTVAIGAEDKKEEPWRRIFDGERLKGWKPNERPKNWGVEDGAIYCKAKGGGKKAKKKTEASA